MIVHVEKTCSRCVWFSGTEHDIAAQRMTRCEKLRTPVYADDTCDQWSEVRPTRRDMEHVKPIVARVMKQLEKPEAA